VTDNRDELYERQVEAMESIAATLADMNHTGLWIKHEWVRDNGSGWNIAAAVESIAEALHKKK
jgi:hypothetical protein